jgi:hypothetical protein
MWILGGGRGEEKVSDPKALRRRFLSPIAVPGGTFKGGARKSLNDEKETEKKTGIATATPPSKITTACHCTLSFDDS